MNIKYDKYLDIISKSMHLRNKIMKAKAKELGLSDGEAAALMFFFNQDGKDTAADMVKECCVSKAFVSKILISLMTKKLVVIKTNKKDKRERNITITTEGKEKAKILSQTLFEYLDSLFEGVTAPQLEELDRIFDIFEKNTDSINRKDGQV